MGRRGPPPDPNSGRTKRGLNSLNTGNVVKFTPTRGVGRARMPEWLDGDAAAFWHENAPELHRMGTLDGLSGPLFAMVCVLYGRIRKCEQIIASESALLTGPGGKQVKHPAVRIRDQATMKFIKMGSEMGMTPLGRARLGIQTPE